MFMFASSLFLPLFCSDRREAASYLGSHDEEQDATSKWSISVSCMQPLTVTWSYIWSEIMAKCR